MDQPMIKNKTCTACGAHRKAKTIVFHPTTFEPYCENPYLCNEDHPNSALNLIQRGEILELISFDNVQEKYKEYLEHNHAPGTSDRIRRIVTHPVSVRIGSMEVGEFLTKLQEEQKLATTSDAIRYCIQVTMESRGEFYKDKKIIAQEKKEEKKLQQAIETIQEQVTENDEEWTF